MHTTLAVLWSIFALIFFFLAYRQRKAAQQMAPHFSTLPDTRGASIVAGELDIEKAISEFVVAFNCSIDQQNKSNHDANMLAFWGYIAALVTAAISAGAEVFQLLSGGTI